MKTRKKIYWLWIAAHLFIVGNMQIMATSENKEEIKTVPIPIVTGDVLTGKHHRDFITIPFAAYYQGGTIYISTSAELTSIDIHVLNETTGQTWHSTTDISDGMGEICIVHGEAGSYSIEIITEYGECFVGSFHL